MGEITRLDEDIVLPNLNPDEEVTYEFIRELIGELEKNIGAETNTIVNLILDQGGSTSYVYFGIPDGNGIYPDGSWRINANSSDEYLIQIKVSGSWVTKSTLTDEKMFRSGGQGWATKTVTGDYTILDGEYLIKCNSALAMTLTPPSLTGTRSIRVSVGEGMGNVTFAATVNGIANEVFYAGETADLTDDGAEWRV